MFNLMLLLDIAEGRPGMLVPVFSSDKTNMPYVQQMDEYLLVKDIIPFLEYENYTTLPAERALSVSLGEKGVIAFRSADDAIICGDFQDVLAYVRDHVDLLTKDPLLKMQRNRINPLSCSRLMRIGEKFAARSLATQIRANSRSILSCSFFRSKSEFGERSIALTRITQKAVIRGLGVPAAT